MSSSQLSVIRGLVNDSQYTAITQYLKTLIPTSKITVSRFALGTQVGGALAKDILKALVDAKILKFSFGVRCPECGLLLMCNEDIALIEKEQYCYQCEKTIDLNPENIEVIYTFQEYPFEIGQRSNLKEEVPGSVVLSEDSVAQLVASGAIDLNAQFFAPTKSDYKELKVLYDSIFPPHPTTKAQGDSLEKLAQKLFNLCKHFKAVPIRLHPNQIDCYVRNTLYIPGISGLDCKDSFVIECKNEKRTPSIGYMNKIHSIMKLHGKKFGIIISKASAPKTFVSLSHDIYLCEHIVIISLDKDDLFHIISGNINLLECLSRKIDEVKLHATKDLIALGLYNG